MHVFVMLSIFMWSRNLRILILDDEADFRSAVRLFLERSGYEVTEAADGAAGLESARLKQPDLIISDIRMPIMSGEDFFKALRTGKSDLDIIPVIFLSGHIDDADTARFLNSGADHCLRKPVSMDLLLAHVRSCLSTSERYGEFIARKLDIVAKFLPVSISHDFRQYSSLVENVNAYVEVVAAILKNGDASFEAEDSDQGAADGSPSAARGEAVASQSSRARYIRFHLRENKKLQSLIENSRTGALTWQLIFLVAESQIADRPIYVSDLYFMAQAAKTTINNHILSLIEDEVFVKQRSPTDGRRQRVSLTDSFANAFYNHIDDTVRKITEIPPQA